MATVKFDAWCAVQVVGPTNVAIIVSGLIGTRRSTRGMNAFEAGGVGIKARAAAVVATLVRLGTRKPLLGLAIRLSANVHQAQWCSLARGTRGTRGHRIAGNWYLAESTMARLQVRLVLTIHSDVSEGEA